MEEQQSGAKRLKGDGGSVIKHDFAVNTVMDTSVLDNDNSNSSNVSNLFSEVDKALQESNKRHVKPIIEESKLGIELFIGDLSDQFHGLIKTRYSDFIVHEIDLEGKLAKLTDLEPPVEEEVTDSLKIEDLFDRKILVCLSNVNNGLLESYKIDVTGMDKDTRTSIHHAIRESYDRLESCTVDENDQNKGRNKPSNRCPAKSAEKCITTNEISSSTPVDDQACKESELNNESEAVSKIEEKKYILVTRRNKSSRHRSIWPRGREDYTHFVLYKENKDTMDAIHNLAVATNSKPNMFSYAGTKDRRAITTQWVCGWRVDPKRLISSMRRFSKRPFIKVGNFSFKKEPIRLGQLRGNKFDLVIRHLVHNSAGEQVIEKSMKLLEDKGFVNYFGLQRFGTRTVQTHEIGLAILQSKWEKAIDMILTYRYDENSLRDANLDGVSSKDQDNNYETSANQQLDSQKQPQLKQQTKYWARGAEQHNACIDLWRSKHDAELVFKKYPHFRITNEGLIMKSLSKISSTEDSSRDYSNALSSLPRNIRSMYVHAYQSLLWNKLATYRLKKYGYKVVKGDLVLPPETAISENSLDLMLNAVGSDESGEVVSNTSKMEDIEKVETENKNEPTKKNDAVQKSDWIEDVHSKILVVREADLDRYTIFDVVLPLPGSRIKEPQNDVANEMERLLKDDSLTLDCFRAREKTFVSYGSYRKIIVRPGNLKWRIKQYSNPRESLVETDLDELDRECVSKDKSTDIDRRPYSPLKSDSTDEALVVSFDLPSSAYATMCLRELMKKPSTEFNNRF